MYVYVVLNNYQPTPLSFSLFLLHRWSFANLGKLPAEFDARLYNTLFLQRLHEAKPMGIANMLYAWTTLDAMPGYDTVER